MKKHIYTIPLCMLVVSLFFSCKKNSSTPNCVLSTLTDSTTSVQSVTQFTYDNSNRLSVIVVSGQYACRRTFQYSGSTIIFSVTDTTPGILNEIDTIVLNSSGFIQTQNIYYPTTGTSSTETFVYDSTGQIPISSVETNNGVPGDTLVYATVNGDLMYEKLIGQSTDENTFTYYSSENILYGDPTDFRQILYYGAYYYKNKHMLNVLYSPGESYKAYTYVFSNGRIAQSTLRMWKSGSADTVTHTLSYAYLCR